MARKSKSAVSIPVPSTTTEANAVLYRVGELNRSVEMIEADYAEAVAKLRRDTDAHIAPLATEREQLSLGLHIFADTNRTTLLSGDTKTVQLSAGAFGWRFTPPKVTLGRGGEGKAIQTIKELKLKGYIRTKESLDKEALLRDRPVVAGIKYMQKEEFFLDPSPVVNDAEAGSNVVRLAQTA
jgi:phage host-nuclease inhibitor protein Gam